MPRRVAGSSLDAEVAAFEAEVHRLALALLEQALTAEIARWRTTVSTMLTDELIAEARGQARARATTRKRR